MLTAGGRVTRCTIRPLDAPTWAELAERNNGVFSGWCMSYNLEGPVKRMGISHRAAEEDRVRTGRAHAALVIDADGSAQGWCQYGSPEELPGTKHKREHDKDALPPPDWRITCIYVDKKHRGQGIARAALEGALDQIARLAANALRIYRGNFDTRLHDRSWLPWPRLLEAIASLPMLVLAGADGGCIPPTLFADARSAGRRLRSGDPARRGGTSCTSSGRTTWPGRRWNGSCLISDDRLPPIRADPPIDTEMSYPH